MKDLESPVDTRARLAILAMVLSNGVVLVLAGLLQIIRPGSDCGPFMWADVLGILLTVLLVASVVPDDGPGKNDGSKAVLPVALMVVVLGVGLAAMAASSDGLVRWGLEEPDPLARALPFAVAFLAACVIALVIASAMKERYGLD